MKSTIKTRVFHTNMQSGSNIINCCTIWRKLNSLYTMPRSSLSPETDLLILKGQTGPIHNAGVLRSIFPLQWESHLLGWQLLRLYLFPHFYTFCYYSHKLTLYPVTSDSFSIALTCFQFRKILELVKLHSMFPGGWLGAARYVIIQTLYSLHKWMLQWMPSIVFSNMTLHSALIQWHELFHLKESSAEKQRSREMHDFYLWFLFALCVWKCC